MTHGGLTFRWADDRLLITTPKGQHTLDAQGTAQLLDWLYGHKDEIFDAEESQGDGRAEWARKYPVQQYVVGSLNPEPPKQSGSGSPLSLEEGRARLRGNEPL